MTNKKWSPRKRIRLAPPDYQIAGARYFLTVCCLKKKPLFRSSLVRTLVVDILRNTAEQCRVELAAYTVLPDHLHIICSAGSEGVVGYVRLFKGRVTKKIREQYGRPSPWQKSFFDHRLRSEESLKQKCQD